MMRFLDVILCIASLALWSLSKGGGCRWFLALPVLRCQTLVDAQHCQGGWWWGFAGGGVVSRSGVNSNISWQGDGADGPYLNSLRTGSGQRVQPQHRAAAGTPTRAASSPTAPQRLCSGWPTSLPRLPQVRRGTLRGAIPSSVAVTPTIKCRQGLLSLRWGHLDFVSSLSYFVILVTSPSCKRTEQNLPAATFVTPCVSEAEQILRRASFPRWALLLLLLLWGRVPSHKRYTKWC